MKGKRTRQPTTGDRDAARKVLEATARRAITTDASKHLINASILRALCDQNGGRISLKYEDIQRHIRTGDPELYVTIHDGWVIAHTQPVPVPAFQQPADGGDDDGKG